MCGLSATEVLIPRSYFLLVATVLLALPPCGDGSLLVLAFITFRAQVDLVGHYKQQHNQEKSGRRGIIFSCELMIDKHGSFLRKPISFPLCLRNSISLKK